jgi:secreted trypsin-like serine protease
VVLFAAVLVAGLFAGTSPAGAAGDDEHAARPGGHWVHREVGQAPPEIVGGTPANPGEFPYQVALAFAGTPGIPIRGQFCGGSLIAPDTVLTAAHCVIDGIWVFIGDDGSVLDVEVDYLKPNNVDVLAGTVDLGANGAAERLDVRQIRLSPDFTVDIEASFNLFLPDVAILQLKTPSTTGTPVDLAVPGQEALYAAGTPSTVSGWGATGGAFDAPPTILQQAELPIVSDADCTIAYGTDFDASRNLCAGDLETGLPSPCFGDSGGPLVVDNAGEPLQVGIVLGGDGCGAPERPSVFSRVAPNADWVGRYLDPDEVPDKPRRTSVARGRSGNWFVQWRPPAFDGGTRITGYRVKVVGDRTYQLPATARRLDMGLQTVGGHRVVVRAVNGVGQGIGAVVSFTVH